ERLRPSSSAWVRIGSSRRSQSSICRRSSRLKAEALFFKPIQLGAEPSDLAVPGISHPCDEPSGSFCLQVFPTVGGSERQVANPRESLLGRGFRDVRLSDIRAKVVGATAFSAQGCRDLGIADKVNRRVEWDQKQWKLSPGTRVVALIINIICHRQPLYRVWEFYEHLDLGLLFEQ